MIKLMLFIAIVFTPCIVQGANTMTITEADSVTQTNRPTQIGTMFLEGEISDYPKVVLDSVAITTQADVKRRWPDGSVRHAILNFLIPSMTANQSITVTFENQLSGNNTALTKSQMLDSAYDFDAEILADFGSGDISTSARTMLNADDYSVWLSGSIATSVILADHSTSRTYDFGDDANTTLRPIYHATFWPTIDKVKVRYIVENSSTEVLQDQSYDVELMLGDTGAVSQYTEDSVPHHSGARWTKSYWIGGEPGQIDIKYDLPYLTSTNEIYSYDTTKTISESIIADVYAVWLTEDTSLFGAGSWDRRMPNAGGRPDLGPYPQWTVFLLYTGDARMQEIVYGNADLASAWPMHFREGDSAKYLDRDSTIPGIGKVMTVSTRPTISIGTGYDYSYTNIEDRITTVGYTSVGLPPDDWNADAAHQPDPYIAPYLLSGDYYYLEGAMMWASWTIALANGAATNYEYGRGPTGVEGALTGELRAKGWAINHRVGVTTLIPDVMPEKVVFNEWVNDIVATEEGRLNITTTGNYNSDLWNWGRTVKGGSHTPPTMHQYDWGSTAFAQEGYGIDESVTETATSLYETGYTTIGLGRAYQLGYAFNPLLSYVAEYYIGAALDVDYSKYLLNNGRIPVTKVSDDSYFSTWNEMYYAYNAERRAMESFPLTDTTHGYDFISNAAIAAVGATNVTNADTAQVMIYNDIGSATILNNDPKWALVPFVPNDPITASSCSVNPSLCIDSETCEGAGWTWCDTYCNATTCPSESVCDSEHLNLCTDQSTCEAATGNWCTDVCQSAPCSTSKYLGSIPIINFN